MKLNIITANYFWIQWPGSFTELVCEGLSCLCLSQDIKRNKKSFFTVHNSETMLEKSKYKMVGKSQQRIFNFLMILSEK